MAKGKISKVRKDNVRQTYWVRLDKELHEGFSKGLKSGKAGIRGIGIFKLKKIPAKKGGKEIVLFGKKVITKSKPASMKIKFRPAKQLKDEVI